MLKVLRVLDRKVLRELPVAEQLVLVLKVLKVLKVLGHKVLKVLPEAELAVVPKESKGSKVLQAVAELGAALKGPKVLRVLRVLKVLLDLKVLKD